MGASVEACCADPCSASLLSESLCTDKSCLLPALLLALLFDDCLSSRAVSSGETLLLLSEAD